MESVEATFENGESLRMPFVKHCAVSALTIDAKQIFILDGINNDGFSGGPVLSRTGTDQRIFAVISGYRNEPGEVIFSGAHKGTPEKELQSSAQPKKGTVNLNSGFIIAFSIKYATDAIRQNPIGPLRSIK